MPRASRMIFLVVESPEGVILHRVNMTGWSITKRRARLIDLKAEHGTVCSYRIERIPRAKMRELANEIGPLRAVEQIGER